MNKLIISSFFLSFFMFACNNQQTNYEKEAKLKLNQGSPREAISLLELAIKQNPENDSLYNLKGVGHFMLDEYSKSLIEFDQAIQLNSSRYQYHYNAGNAYRNLRNYKAAFEAYSKAIQLDSTQSDIYLNRGLVQLSLLGAQEAVIDFDHAEKLNPKDERIYLHRGRAKMLQEKFQEASEDFSKAIELKKDYADAFYHLALSKTAINGPDDEVCKLLQKASDLGNTSAKTAIGEYCL